MKLKKVIALVAVLVILSPVFAQKKKTASAKAEPVAPAPEKKVDSPYKGKTIAVIEPVIKNSRESDSWIPFFVQGQLGSTIQKYTDELGLIFVDRQNQDKAQQEMKTSENAAHSENAQLEAGQFVAGYYIVVTNIIQKGTSYAIDCKINDTQKNTTVGSTSYSNPDCPEKMLTSGEEIVNIAYQLLTGLGIPESKLSELKAKKNDAAKLKIVEANTNLAKGIAAEKTGRNIIEAMSYYQKAIGNAAGLSEAASRLNSMTNDLKVGNLRDQALNQIALRNKWKKIWEDFEVYANDNCPYIIYSTNLQSGNINYEKETLEVYAVFACGLNPEVANLYTSLYSVYEDMKNDGNDVSNWGIKYTFNPKYQFHAQLFDGNGNLIAESKKYSVERTTSTNNGINIRTNKFVFKSSVNSYSDNLKINIITDKKGGIVNAVK